MREHHLVNFAHGNQTISGHSISERVVMMAMSGHNAAFLSVSLLLVVVIVSAYYYYYSFIIFVDVQRSTKLALSALHTHSHIALCRLVKWFKLPCDQGRNPG